MCPWIRTMNRLRRFGLDVRRRRPRVGPDLPRIDESRTSMSQFLKTLLEMSQQTRRPRNQAFRLQFLPFQRARLSRGDSVASQPAIFPQASSRLLEVK